MCEKKFTIKIFIFIFLFLFKNKIKIKKFETNKKNVYNTIKK